MSYRFGLIGHAIQGSLSPKLFAAFGRVSGVDVRYDRLDWHPEAFAAEFSKLRAVLAGGEYRGLNITHPFKGAARSSADIVTADAERIGAINVLSFDVASPGERPEVSAHNTDGVGARHCIDRMGRSLVERVDSVVIFGAGGAAAAISDAVLASGSTQLTICNRGAERAEKLRARLVQVYPRASIHTTLQAPTADLWVQAASETPSALAAAYASASATLPAAPTPKVLWDLRYSPIARAELAKWAARGVQTHDGLELLFQQALAAWAMWVSPFDADQILKIRKELGDEFALSHRG